MSNLLRLRRLVVLRLLLLLLNWPVFLMSRRLWVDLPVVQRLSLFVESLKIVLLIKIKV
jgi:hypothetical protein